MSMHIEGPWLTTTGKRKGQHKFRSAEHKRQHEQQEAEWQQLKERHRTVIDAAKSQKLKQSAGIKRSWSLSIPAGRGTDHIPSRGTGTGQAVKHDVPVYTGTSIKGIGTMHKSNAVPIFSDEEAVEISQMRRN